MPIHLYDDHRYTTTSVSNYFIDELMPAANGEFVKVYLYLLRCMSQLSGECTLSGIADALNHTEADVMRALRYWNRTGALSLTTEDSEICGIHFPDLSTFSKVHGHGTENLSTITSADVFSDSSLRAEVTTASSIVKQSQRIIESTSLQHSQGYTEPDINGSISDVIHNDVLTKSRTAPFHASSAKDNVPLNVSRDTDHSHFTEKVLASREIRPLQDSDASMDSTTSQRSGASMDSRIPQEANASMDSTPSPESRASMGSRISQEAKASIDSTDSTTSLKSRASMDSTTSQESRASMNSTTSLKSKASMDSMPSLETENYQESNVFQETSTSQKSSASQETRASQKSSASQETTVSQETGTPQKTMFSQEASFSQEARTPLEEATSARRLPSIEDNDASPYGHAHSIDSSNQESHTVTAARILVEKTSGSSCPREYSLNEVQQFKRDESISQLFSIIEMYMKHPLSSTDTDTVLYWLDELHFPIDLVIYLVESCIDRKHLSFHYMNRIAMDWSRKQIFTVEQARSDTTQHSTIYYNVMKAFGISGRNLGDTEASLLDKWTNEYAFSNTIILEACRRTMTAIHQPSFEYTDTILERWHKNNVHRLEDIRALDKDYNSSKKSSRSKQSARNTIRKNSFTNFEQRDNDFDNLEKLLLTTTV